MRLSLRIVLLTALSAVLILSVTGVAAAKGGPKPPPPQSNNPHLAEAQDNAQATAAGQGATAQPGGCQTTDPTVTGTGNVVLNPNGATNFVCHGQLPAGSPTPDRPVKVDLGDECDTILTPSGRVRTICHSRP